MQSLTESTGTRFLHDVVRVLVVLTVLCMVMVAESTHFDRLTNLVHVRYRREPPSDVCKKRYNR